MPTGTTTIDPDQPVSRSGSGTVTVGSLAPDVAWASDPATGQVTHLSDLWRGSERGLALILLRHFGCPFCKEHAHDIHAHRAAFREHGIGIVMIGPGTSVEAGAFRTEQQLDNPVLANPGREVYRAFGLGEARVQSLLSPQVLAGGVRAAIKGYLPKRSAGAPLQLQGQFLIDRDGIIRSGDRPTRMSDNPSARTLLAHARALAAPLPAGVPIAR